MANRWLRYGLAPVGSRQLPGVGATLVSGGAGDRRRTRAISSGGLTFGRALGSHRRDTERRALAGPDALSRSSVRPGWAGSRVENTTFLQDLASRGFIVAGIGYDDPACAGVDRSSGDAAATDMDFSSQAAFERTLGVANRKIARVAEAASHVIDALEVLDRVDPNGRFGGRLDLDRIGVVGYSLGGAIAMQLCWRDNRLRAAVNVGGWLFDAARGGWIDQPFMIIADDGPATTSADLSNPDPARRYRSILTDASDRRISREFAKHGGIYVAVQGSDHQDFSDMAYLSRLVLLRGRRPESAAIRIAAEYSAAFFRQTLNGEVSPLFSSPRPDVRLRAWDRPSHQESAK